MAIEVPQNEEFLEGRMEGEKDFSRIIQRFEETGLSYPKPNGKCGQKSKTFTRDEKVLYRPSVADPKKISSNFKSHDGLWY